MKMLILLSLLVSSFAFANEITGPESLWPRVTAWSNGVDLQIHNYTEDDYSCSGSIYINHQSGKMSTEYYFGRVYARMYERRHYMNRYFNDPIMSAHHSVSCFRL